MVERLKLPINEEMVVDLIKRWRVRETSEESDADEVKKAELALMNLLRQDDVMSYKYEKIKYEQYKDPKNMEEDTESINRKLEKLGDIFKATSKKIEWETIRSHQRHWRGFSGKSDILKYYTTLNEDFTKCLKNENKATDGKDIGDKRVKNSLLAKKF
ncbi:hypothetical protein RhiirA5_428901 [Rhizophagus irregularis]|uniref:Uncharacterized protein n=1 Tax=Rhizophagus irregularis TaxID=588596 RepID=A0A2N0NZH2_9GLOM|nr:hypothetical protein RhiirA5_428901 [Rhizophagus irregularis]